MGNKRIQWIDAVKGIGILLVIWSHLCYVSHPLFFYFCYGFMPIFYVMAGFTNKPSHETFSLFLAKKAKRLLIPYVFYAIVIMLCISLIDKDWSLFPKLQGILYGRYSLYGIGKEQNIMFLGAVRGDYIAPLWFLPSLLMGYIWVYVYDFLKDRFKPELLIAVLSILAICSYFIPVLLPWSVDTSFMIALFILFGRSFFSYFKESKNRDYLIGVILVFLYLILCFLNKPVNFSIAIYGEQGLFSVFLFFLLGVIEPVFLSLFCRRMEKTLLITFLAYIGRQSLRLLCIHIFVCKVLIEAGWTYGILTKNGLVLYWISFSMIFIVNAFLDLIFEKGKNKIPILKYL